MNGTGLSMWRSVRIVLRKEITDGVRDWRSILTAFTFPIMGPLLIVWVFSLIADVSKEPETVTLPTVGKQNAPELTSWLGQNGVEIVDAPKDPKKSVRDSSIDMALRIPDEFGKEISQGQRGKIELLIDSTSRGNRPAFRKVSRLIAEYSGQLGALRLIARGVSPKVAQPIALQKIDVANNMEIVARILNIIPLFALLAVFVCGMMLAIDTTVGERERGSLESLLLSPISRRAIVVGKWLATSFFSAAGLIFTMIGCLGVLKFIPIEERGFSFSVNGSIVIGMLATMLPLALLASALLLFVATFARSFKEASVTTQFLIFLAMAPSFIEPSGSGDIWMYAVPILGQYLIILDLLAGAAPSFAMFILSGAISLGISLIAVEMTARLFSKESTIFGR